MGPVRVGIIGGGIAGLAAWAEVRRLGGEALLFEAEAELGGLARAESLADLRVPRAAQRLRASDRAYRAAWFPDGTAPPLRYPEIWRCVPGNHSRYLASWRGPFSALRSGRGERRLLRLAGELAAAPRERFDDRSLADHARLYFGRRAGADHARRIADWLGLLPETTSRAAVWGFENDVGDLGVPVCPPAEGTAVEGVWRSTRVSSSRADTSGFVLDAEGAGAAQAKASSFDGLLFATPSWVTAELAKELLPPAAHEILSGIRYRPAAVLHLCLDRPLFARCVEILSPESAPAVARLSVERGGEKKEHVALVASPAVAARMHDNRELEAVLLDAGELLAPGLIRSVGDAQLCRIERGVPELPVGHFRRMSTLREILRGQRAAGRAFACAGDYELRPTIESAAHSGSRAAGELMASLAPDPR